MWHRVEWAGQCLRPPSEEPLLTQTGAAPCSLLWEPRCLVLAGTEPSCSSYTE